MNITQLEYFLAAMNCGSISAAARKLFVSQPAVSKQLKALEKELGVTLFQHQQGRLRPEPAAEFLRQKAATMLDEFTHLPEALAGFQHKVAGVLRIGCGPYSSRAIMPDVVAEMLSRHPQVEPRIVECDDFYQRLLARELDVMVGVQPPGGADERWEYRRLHRSPIVVIASRQSPLAAAAKATAKTLALQPYLSLSYNPIRGEIFAKFPFLQGNRFIVESRYSSTLLAYAKRNLGFTMLPEYLLPELPKELVKIKFNTGLFSESGYITLRGRATTPALSAFLTLLHDAAK